MTTTGAVGPVPAGIYAGNITLGRRLGAGGEADVFAVEGRPGVAFKRYRDRQGGGLARATKLRAMIAQPPAEASPAAGHVAIAWPSDLVLDGDGQVAGFLMPAVDASRTLPIFQLYNPQSRLLAAPGFNWRYLLRTARNVAAIVDALHRSGYVVGDLNESNLLVNRRALVTLVDCDSMQVVDRDTGDTFRCPVGKPEFLAPEFQGTTLSGTDRTREGDCFALAVLVFLLLMEGVHPFAGVWTGPGDPPDIATRIRRRITPHRGGRLYRLSAVRHIAPPPMSLPLDALPAGVRRLMRRTFGPGGRRPSRRPTAAEWLRVLDEAETSLRTCTRSPEHVYSRGRRHCPWCERFDAGLPDPFPGLHAGPGLTRQRPRRRPAKAARAVMDKWWAAVRGAVGARLRLELPTVAVACAAALAPFVVVALALLVTPVAMAGLTVADEHRRWWRRVRALPPVLRDGLGNWWWRSGIALAAPLAGAAGLVALADAPPGGALRAATAGAGLALTRLVPGLVPGWCGPRSRLAGAVTRRSLAIAAALTVTAVAINVGGGPWWPLLPPQ